MYKRQHVGNEYITSLKFPYDVFIQHKILIKNNFNWNNSFQITSPTKNIQILNKQETVENTRFNHASMFTINSQTYSIRIFSNSSTENHKGLNLPHTIVSIVHLTVPWRDPIKIGGTLFVDEVNTTRKVKMEAYVECKQNESFHLLTSLKYNGLQGNFDSIIKFPLGKQISLTGGYDCLLYTSRCV